MMDEHVARMEWRLILYSYIDQSYTQYIICNVIEMQAIRGLILLARAQDEEQHVMMMLLSYKQIGQLSTFILNAVSFGL